MFPPLSPAHFAASARVCRASRLAAATVLALAVSIVVSCDSDVIVGPLNAYLVGDWVSVEPTGQTLAIDKSFDLEWSGSRTAAFAAGSAGTPDAITLDDGTLLQAVGAANQNGTIDDGEAFESADASVTLAFSGSSAELTAAFVTTLYQAWSETSGVLTLTANDTGSMSGSARTVTRTGMSEIIRVGFAITPGSPHTLEFLGYTLVADGNGDTLISGSPWRFTTPAQDRTLQLKVTSSTLSWSDIWYLPPGTSSSATASHGLAWTRSHDYDGSALSGALELHHRSADGDYTIEDLTGGAYRLTMWNTDSDVADFTTVRGVAGTALEITFMRARWFRNGGSATILGPWSDGADAIVTFSSDGTFELDPGNAEPMRHGHWRQSSGRAYMAFDEVYER